MAFPVTECARCAQPAVKHDTTTGETHHLDRRKKPCKTASAKPATSGKE